MVAQGDPYPDSVYPLNDLSAEQISYQQLGLSQESYCQPVLAVRCNG